MTPPRVLASLREWTRRVWGALSGRRSDHDLQRELAAPLAEDEPGGRVTHRARPRDCPRRCRRPHPGARCTARTAQASAESSWLDAGSTPPAREELGLTLVGGLAMTGDHHCRGRLLRSTSSCGVRFRSTRVTGLLRSGWDREAGRRRTQSQDLERWRASLVMIDDVGAPGDPAQHHHARWIGRARGGRRDLGRRVSGREGAAAHRPADRRRRRSARRRPRRRHRPRRLAAALCRRARRQRTRTAARQGRTYHRRCHAGRLPVPLNFQCWVPLQPGNGDLCATPVPRRRLRRLAGCDDRARTLVSALGILPPALRSAQSGDRTPRGAVRLPSRDFERGG